MLVVFVTALFASSPRCPCGSQRHDPRERLSHDRRQERIDGGFAVDLLGTAALQACLTNVKDG